MGAARLACKPRALSALATISNAWPGRAGAARLTGRGWRTELLLFLAAYVVYG